MASRVDMHCHSTASQLSRLGVQRSLGLPECATPPYEVYELAKRRGMDFVTITDHDTIDAARARSWDRAMEQLADGYSRTLGRESPIRLSPTSGVVKVGSAAPVHAA